MPSDVLQAFRDVAVFRTLPDHQLRPLAVGSFVQAFPQDTLLHSQGAIPDFLFAVISGGVEVVAQHERATNTVRVLGPGESFAVPGVLTFTPALASARTATRSRILMVPASRLRAAVDEDHAFARHMVAMLADEARNFVRALHDLKMQTSPQRLARWIARQGHDAGDCPTIQLPYQKKVLASLLGMTPENLSRTFDMLRPHGVTVHGRQIAVSSMAALAELAEPSPLLDAPA